MREQRVPAARDQAQKRRRERAVRLGVAVQEVRRDVPLDVVDGGERKLTRGGEPLRGRESHEQRSHEAGPLRGGDEIHVIERRASLAQRLGDDRVRDLQMVARGDLRHHAAEAIVRALGGDHVRAHQAVGIDNRRAGVVAAALEREDRHTGPGFGTSSNVPASVAGVRHMTSASSPLSW